MSDLISREALIKAMEKKYDVAKETGMYPLGLTEAFIITEKIIQEQPTAYDMDKVVKKLNYRVHNFRNTIGILPHAEIRVEAFELAIDIVRRGGKNE